MDSHTITMIVVLGVMILMSAYFSATETAFSSFNRIRMKNMANAGNEKAELVMELSENFDRVLSTILIGNNIVNIGSASLATVLFTQYFPETGVTLSTIVMTILVLIFGEISPKSIAKEMPEKFAMFSAPYIQFIAVVLTPLNIIFMKIKDIVTRMVSVNDERGEIEEELITIVEEATQDGDLEEHEGDLIRSAIEFDDLSAGDILTPRTRLFAIEDDESVESINRLFNESGFSRIPVYHTNIDNIIGVIHLKNFRKHLNEPIENSISNVLYIPPSMKISKLLKQLQANKTHLAVVLDEYGGTLGIVTLEDILEELVGEIYDEHDDVTAAFQQVKQGEYLIDASTDIEDFFDMFQIKEESESSTVGGWVIDKMQTIPKEKEFFNYNNLTITIVKVEYNRIVEIKVVIDKE